MSSRPKFPTVTGYQGGERDHEGRRRVAFWLPDEVIDWLDTVARHDGSSRSDLLEGIVLLAIETPT